MDFLVQEIRNWDSKKSDGYDGNPIFLAADKTYFYWHSNLLSGFTLSISYVEFYSLDFE